MSHLYHLSKSPCPWLSLIGPGSSRIQPASDPGRYLELFMSPWASSWPSLYCSGFSSVSFSNLVLSDSLRAHGLLHTRLPCPSPTPGVYSNSCPLNQWCHPTISSSVIPFSSRHQSFPASESVQVSWFFSSGSQSTGVSDSASVLPMNIQDWFPLGWTGWVSLLCKVLSGVFSNTTVWSISSLVFSFLSSPTLISIHDYWKNHRFD